MQSYFRTSQESFAFCTHFLCVKYLNIKDLQGFEDTLSNAGIVAKSITQKGKYVSGSDINLKK